MTLGSIGDAVLTFDTKGNVTYLNCIAERQAGWTNDEALGRPAREVLRLTLSEAAAFKPIEPIAKVFDSGTTLHLMKIRPFDSA